MTLARLVLVLNAITFAVLGAWSLLAPATVASHIDLGLTSPTARADFMAFYGGFELGLAAFLAWCALRPARVRPGLVALGLGLSGAGLGRLAGILSGGPVQPNMYAFLVFELGFAALCAILLRRTGGA